MSTTLASVVANVQRRMDSATTNDADVVAAKIGQVINEIYAAFAPQYPSFSRKSATFDTVASQREYDVTALGGVDARAIAFIEPPSGSDANGLGMLVRISQRELLQLYGSSTTGTARYWAPTGAGTFWLGPIPDSALTYTVYYWDRPTIPTTNDGSYIDLPDDVAQTAETGAVAYFKDELGYVDAEQEWARYEKRLDEVRTRYFPDDMEGIVEIQHQPIRAYSWVSSTAF